MKPSLALRSIHLRVSDLARSLDFYTAKIGLCATAQTSDRAHLAAAPGGVPLLALSEDKAAPAPPADAAGLFHAALLLPSRAELGCWLRHAADAGVAFDGFSDHGVSEAIYLTDPDGNGWEFYSDRPREKWPQRNGELAMGTLPLDVDSLLSAAQTSALNPAGPILAVSRWGHLHLRVTDLDRSEKFYRGALGVTLMQQMGANARFLSVDGYHHHLGLNNWGGVRQPRPSNALGLIEAVFARHESVSEKHFVDPDNIPITVSGV